MRHFCFLCGIVEVLPTEKLALELRNMAERTVRFERLSEDGGRIHLERGGVKPGHTVAVIYALQHPFTQGYLGDLKRRTMTV